MSSLGLRARSNLVNLIPKRFASTATASKMQETRKQIKGSIKMTKLDNGVLVASLENGSPISRVAAVLNTGSRDESHVEQGSCHALRVFSNLATRNFSSFGITRNLDQIGAQLRISSTRETTTYILENVRNNTSRGVDILSEIVSRPQLRHWEIDDARPRLEFELDVYDQQPELRIVDMIHKASYKNALSNSIYAPRFNVSNLQPELLVGFREKNFTLNRLTLIGLGVEHDDLIRFADQFRLPTGNLSRQVAQFISSELREENLNDLVHVAIAAEGVSQSSKEVLVSALASHAFGSVSGRIKYSNGASRLSRSVLPLARESAGVTSFNVNYSDSGLFGFHLIGSSNDIGKLTRGLYQELNKVAKNGFSNDEISRAKNCLKISLANSLDSSEGFIEALIRGPNNVNVEEILKSVDDVKSSDINEFVKRIASSKHSSAAIGNLSEFPRLDELRV